MCAIQTKDDNKEKSNGQGNVERVLGIVCSQETHLNLHDVQILSTIFGGSNMSHLVLGLNPTVLAKGANTSTDRVAEEQRGRTRTRCIDWSRKATISIESKRTMLFTIFTAEVCFAETSTILS